jgi:dipeptidyl aminopeptidase/acylaminoacyl peptidase
VVNGYPRWSPTGDRLAYIAEDSDKKAQVFVLSMAGGDSMQLTHSAGAITQFAWKPDGTALAYAAVDEVPKREGEAKFLDAFEVGANDSLVAGPSPSTHIWLIAASGGDAKRLTSGAWSLPVSFPPWPPASPINWTRDGKQIAFVKAIAPVSGDWEHTQMQLLDVATGESRALTQRTQLESYPLISPDGANVAYWYPVEGKAWNVAGAAATDWVNMYATSDLSVTNSDQVGGSPYTGDNIKSYRDQSPISFAKNIHAPTLILHDTGDTRTPIANSCELFRALKDNDVTVQFFAYPISGHSPNDPIRARDVRKRWVEWIAKYLGTEAPVESASE